MKILSLLTIVTASIFIFSSCSKKIQDSTSYGNSNEKPRYSASILWEGKWLDFQKDSMDMAIYKPNPGKFNNDVIMITKYPARARENGIEGTCTAVVIINELGLLETAEIVKGIGYGCDEEFLRAIREKARGGFEPARYKGITTKCKFYISIRYGLT